MVREVNIEFGYPSADEARRRLGTELDLARRQGVAVLKLIHGYGSSGRGGKLRASLRAQLHQLQERGLIGSIVPGETWTIFDETSRALLDRNPDLRRDRDLDQANAGMTLIETRAPRRSG